MASTHHNRLLRQTVASPLPGSQPGTPFDPLAQMGRGFWTKRKALLLLKPRMRWKKGLGGLKRNRQSGAGRRRSRQHGSVYFA